MNILLIFIIFLVFIFYKYNIRICLFYKIFHIPCSGCGGSRAIILLLKGNVLESLKYNILPLIILIIMAIIIFWKIIDYLTNKKTFQKFVNNYKEILILGSIILTIISWIKNINNPLLY